MKTFQFQTGDLVRYKYFYSETTGLGIITKRHEDGNPYEYMVMILTPSNRFGNPDFFKEKELCLA